MAAQDDVAMEPGGRKQRRLADGRISRGYVPVEVEAIEARVSAEALGLLLHIRLESSLHERDGELDVLDLHALGVRCKLPSRRLKAVVDELRAAGLLDHAGDEVLDVNYATWGRTRDEREERREKWRERKARSRATDPPKEPDVTPASQRDIAESHGVTSRGVTRMSQTKEAEAEAEVRNKRTPPPTPPSSVTSPVTPLPLPPEVERRARDLDEACNGILARPLKGPERDLVLRWASTLRRSGELVAVDEVLDVVRREMGRPTPEGPLPANLGWCADAVATLARERAGPNGARAEADWRRKSHRLNPNLLGGAQ